MPTLAQHYCSPRYDHSIRHGSFVVAKLDTKNWSSREICHFKTG